MDEGEICLKICPHLLYLREPAPITACVVEQAGSKNRMLHNVDKHRGCVRYICCRREIYCVLDLIEEVFGRQAWVVGCPDALVVLSEVAGHNASIRCVEVMNKLQRCDIGKYGDAVV